MNRAWMRDPLRAGMEARVRGTQRLALGAALTLAFFALALKRCAAMEGAAVIALVGAGCAALLLAGAWRALREEPVIVLLCAALLAMLAVAAHLAMLDIKPGRMSKVLAPMLEDMWNYDLGTAMAWEDGAWSGGYLIVMALISRLETFPQMYAVKLFDMACQTAAALAVLKLALTRGAKPGAAVGAMLACVLAPTMLLSAGCWAQCDAMFAALALWGLALLLKDHPVWGCILWGLAASLEGAADYEAGFTQLVEQSANKYLRHFVFYCCGRAVAVLLGNPSDFEEYLHILADEICQLADRALGRTANVGVSREFARLSELNDAYRQAVEALHTAAEGEGGVSFTADARKTGSLCDRALEIIDQHYMDEDLSLASLSAMLDVSPNHLSACIKKSEGETFINILVRRRMEKAQALLLTTDMQIQEIARCCGYTDQHYFSYCFKKYSGTSPVALRRARAAGEART